MFCFRFITNKQKFPIYLWSRLLSKYETNATHYDVLNLQRNCTADEIRDAFIKLSKLYHPDVKGPHNNPNMTAQFVKVQEAYQILSKNVSRTAYDQDLNARGYYSFTHSTDFHSPQTETWKIHPNYHASPGPYYGVKGWKKVSNNTIMWLCLAFAILGTTVEFFLVRNSFTLNRQKLDDLSREASISHQSVRADAVKYGNEKQLERVIDRLLKTP